MFAGLCKSMSHPFIQDPKHKNHHHHPRHYHQKSYTRLELPLLLPERNEGLHLVEIMGSCNVAIMPQQTRRGHQLTPKGKKNNIETPSPQ